eukprot:15109_6
MRFARKPKVVANFVCLSDILHSPSVHLVFLGDYVDRGPKSFEIVTIVSALKLKYPSRVHLLRGNHECAEMSVSYSLESHIKYPILIRNIQVS